MQVGRLNAVAVAENWLLPTRSIVILRPICTTPKYVCTGAHVRVKPNSITLASSELAPNMFEAGSCQIPLH